MAVEFRTETTIWKALVVEEEKKCPCDVRGRATNMATDQALALEQAASGAPRGEGGKTEKIEVTYTEQEEAKGPRSSSVYYQWLEEILWCVVSIMSLMGKSGNSTRTRGQQGKRRDLDLQRETKVIVAVLRAYDGRPLPTLPMHITLNTFLAFFTTLTKAAFAMAVAEALSQWKWNWFEADRPLTDFQTFDAASRGPWGSLKLLARLRGR